MSDDTFNAPKRRNRNKVPELNDGIKKLGRKKKNDNKERLHNKSSEDNIIKKIMFSFGSNICSICFTSKRGFIL